MIKLMFALLIMLISVTATFAQEASAPANTVEFRFSGRQYGYADWMHAFSTKRLGLTWASDLYMVKTPGSTELDAGGGVIIPLGKTATIAPLGYAVVDPQSRQAGVKAATLAYGQHKRLKFAVYAARNFNLKGDDYTVVDDANVTVAAGPFDFGPSFGYFDQAGVKNFSTGGMVRWNHEKIFPNFSLRRDSFGKWESRGGLVATF